MNRWARGRLGDLVAPVRTWNPARSIPDDTFLYIDLSSVDQETKRIVAAREVSCGEAPSRARQLVATNDVLVSTVRPNLNGVARVPKEMDGATASTGFCVLRACDSKLDPAFLFHWVKAAPFVAEMVSKTTGASYPAVSDRIVLESFLPLPPVLEQRRIAEVLDRAEALWAKRHATLVKLDDLLQAVFIETFGDPASNPRGWERKELGVLCTIAGEYGAGVAAKEHDADLPRYVRITDVTADGDLTSSAVSPSGESADWRRFLLAPGDLLFARSGATVGKTYLHRARFGNCVFAGYLIRFRPDLSQVLPEYVFHFTRTRTYRAWVAARQRVVAQPNINAQQYARELLLPLPPISLQHGFAQRLEAIDRIKTHCETSLAQLEMMFVSLQHRAFRGEL